MKFEIDTDKVVEKAIGNLVEGDILKNVIEDSRIEDIVDDIFSQNDTRCRITDKVNEIIDAYFNSDEGKDYIINEIKSELDNSDLLTDDKITELVAEFLKKKLE